MKKYKTLPVLVEAVKWDGTYEHARKIEQWSGEEVYCTITNAEDWFYNDADPIRTLVLLNPVTSVSYEAQPGDWVVKCSIGYRFYKPDLFESAFEEIKDDDN